MGEGSKRRRLRARPILRDALASRALLRMRAESEDKAHRSQRAQFLRIQNRAALDDLQHAVLAAQLVAVAADELLVGAAAAEAVDGEIGRGRDDVVLQP